LATEKQIVVTSQLNDAGLTAVDATSPSFMTEVQKLIDSNIVRQASSVLPYSLIIKNDTGRYVWGFTVLYTFPDSISPSGNPHHMVISPSPGGPAVQSGLLAPGSTYLITPVSGLIASSGDAAGNRKVVPHRSGEDLGSAIRQFNSSHGSGRGRIEVSVDAVVFEDGTLVGPDEGKLMSRVNSKIRGQKDLADALGNLRGQELQAKLSFYRENGLQENLEPSGANSRSSIEIVASSYYLTVRNNAAVLLSILQSQGEPAVLQEMEKMRSPKWFPGTGFVRRK
jgi:hypothetical protein